MPSITVILLLSTICTVAIADHAAIGKGTDRYQSTSPFVVKAGHRDSNLTISTLTANVLEKHQLSGDTTGTSSKHVPGAPSGGSHNEIALWGWRWSTVSTYFVISAFLLIAAVIKILYHHSSIHHHVPESCVLIIFGTLFELVLYLADVQEHVPKFSSDVFFFLLLPPIILESAYSLHDRTFFNNLGTIILYAIVGTLINVFLIGPGLYLFNYAHVYNTYIPFVECLTFSTLISAVDPVAVLAIFQEIGVNKALYFLVFGESLLNDAVVITLYNSITIFAGSPSVEGWDVFLGMLNFVTVSCGGLTIGLLLGAVTAIITRYTTHVRVVEPLIVIAMAYMSYVTAELFHFSGIIGLIGCGLMQMEYTMHNISNRSYVTIKYFTRNISSISDVIIFFFLGKVLVKETHVWDTTFVLLSTLFCVLFRFLSVFCLTFFANYFFKRIRFINFEEQVVMSYGGLRGAIAFSLAITLNKTIIKNAELFITATLFVILFTVFVLGSTTKTIVRLLRVKTEVKKEPKMFVFMNNKLMEAAMAGLEEIAGQKSSNHWYQRMSQFNDKYIKRVLIKGGAFAANGYTEVYEKVKNTRPRSTFPGTQGSIRRYDQTNKNVRFSMNGSTTAVGPEAVITVAPRRPTAYDIEVGVQGHSQTLYQPTLPTTWSKLKNAFDFANKTRRAASDDETEEPASSPETGDVVRRNSTRRPSVLSVLKRADTEEDETERIRRTLSSAFSRTSYYQLPGSLYHEDEEHHAARIRENMSRYKAGQSMLGIQSEVMTANKRLSVQNKQMSVDISDAKRSSLNKSRNSLDGNAKRK